MLALACLISEYRLVIEKDGRCFVDTPEDTTGNTFLSIDGLTTNGQSEEIFEGLARMGYEKPSQKLTFYKAYFFPQWKFLIHTILKCLSAKTTAWNEFSSTMASAIICLSNNQKFNFSKHKEMYVISSHIKKIFANMRRIGAGFSGIVTPFSDTMMVQAAADMEDEDHVPTPSSDPLPSGKDSYTINKLMVFCTSLQEQVFDLQEAKDAQSKEIATLKKKEDSLGAQEDASKHERMIKEIDQDDEIALDVDTQGRKNDDEMFGVDDLFGEEVVLDTTTRVQIIEDVSTAKPVTTAGEVVTTIADKVSAAPTTDVTGDEITMAQALAALKSTKPKIVVQEQEVSTTILAAATTVTTAVPTPRAKGRGRGEVGDRLIVLMEVSEKINLGGQGRSLWESDSLEREEYSEVQKARLLVELIEKRKKHFAALRAQEKRNKPHTKAQMRSQMCTYLRNMGGYKHSHLKGRIYDEKQKVDENVEPVIDDTKELKKCMEIVPGDGDETYFKIIRADGNSQVYQTFEKMFKNFNREDLEVSWAIVKDIFKKEKPVDDMDNLLFRTLKTMFEHNVEDVIWTYQQGLAKVYPLTRNTLHQLWNDVRLQVDYDVEMAYDLLRFIRKQLMEDFVILKMEEDSKVPLILGRPFLYTVDAAIRVKQKQHNLEVRTERMIFHIDFAIKHSYSNDGTCFSIDVIDEILEEEFDALLYEGNLELKPLLDNLEYVFLKEPSLLPVIISSQLSEQNKNKLVSALKRHKKTFAWKTTNIPGICPSCSTFQRSMLAIFHDMIEESIEVFMDDFFFFGNSFDHCLNNLDKMLQRCKDAHLVFNWEKYHFMVKEVIVLGHKVSKISLEVNKEKIEVISKLLPPTNIKGIRSFLGHAGFYQRFIKDFSNIAHPLTKLLEKDNPFEFNDECYNTFKLLKEKLICAPVIVSPNWELPFEIMCDASDFAVEAILGQKDGKNFHPIYFASKTLNAAQQNYTITKKELMAVVFTFDKIRSYLVLSKMKVHTDHSALRHLFKKQDAKPRLIRWILLLHEFDIEMKDRKGIEKVAADHLSRIKNDETSDDNEVDDNFPGETIMQINTEDEPWFADFSSYLVSEIIPKGMKFMNYLEEQTDGEAMINCIKNGDQQLPRVTQVSIAGTSSTEQPPLKDKFMWSDQEKKIQKIDRLARSLLIQKLPNDIYSLIDSNKTTKDLLDALARHMFGSEYGKQDRKAAVLYEYETFKATKGELLLDTYIRYLQSNDKKDDEKNQDMSKVKYYNCKKEGHFPKDCKKIKVKDYEYYKTKMLLAKKDKDKQVLLAEDQAWMESSSDSDQEINSNMVSYYLSESESESEYETLEYYDNTTTYGLFVNDNDDQEIFHDCENFPKNLIESQINLNESAVDHNDYKGIDKLIRKLNKKIAKCLKRIEKANQQNKDFENQNKDLQDKYDVLKNQATTFEMKNKELNEQLKVLIEKNDDLLAQTNVLKDQFQVKLVVIETSVECQEKYAKHEAEGYEYMIRYSAYFDNDKQHWK
uniref:Reverse transcriptase domain-containing protein n=1 Tax=Tanacetum cinerariifolium TaxID=118510 RepID=A0A6L2LDH8_TANCI|nr:reverse transcriptase domain-containing protein [Tanacetum cinerariifolium]